MIDDDDFLEMDILPVLEVKRLRAIECRAKEISRAPDDCYDNMVLAADYILTGAEWRG